MRGYRPIAFFLLGLVAATTLAAAPPASTTADREPPPLPGVELAETLATATGIAITPMLGVSAVGAWRYWKTPESERDSLAWFCSPWVWGPGLLLTLLLILKDPLLGAVPPLKKPIDAMEVIENKASALVATPAVVPMFLTAFGAATSVALTWDPVVTLPLAISGAALEVPAPLAMVGYALMAGLFMVAFFVVWLAFHAINVLILLSPFGILDIFLRSIKFVVLSVLLTATWLSPWLGVGVALLILLVSIPIAGWSLRLTSFGWVVAWDLIRLRHRRSPDPKAPITAFTAGRGLGVPGRTLGRLTNEEGSVVFSYRPWLILRSRNLDLAGTSLGLERSLLCPLVKSVASEDRTTLFRLPPRYRKHEARVAQELGASGVADAPVLRGFRAAWAWARETVASVGPKRETPLQHQ